MAGETEIFGALNNLLSCVGVVAVFSFLIWACYKVYNIFFKAVESEQAKDIKYNLVEELAIGKTANKKGININKEILKREMVNESVDSPTFKQKLKQEVREDFFGPEIKEEEDEGAD